MASFLLIHGAWHGGWCFDRLRGPLEATGHVVAAPDLPGMGGDARALGAASLSGWAAFVAEEARKLPSPVILCGHSRGGLVISQAAEHAPELFSDLVYITAALVPDGKSLYDVIGAAMEGDDFGTALSPVADGLGLVFDAEAAIPVFYNQCAPADQAASAARLVAEPVRPLGTPLSLSAARFGSLPRHYIECANDQCFPLAAQRAMQAGMPCDTVVTLESDHSPFVCVPEQLAGVLIEIANRRET
ncbi:alpha/beta fold hydrolase [Sphingobium nicotianae]|uniref:Alpha/beta fold hydrolase n=1 Tax=Sphingobium nicotianae TaxID=2782607 RepID=A0A9X1DBP5_9SPHN|nr:alpha/beta fold hydrolase [Sphingobium nicotianae]MBT2187027.1 alpha/beta fold hydrolase [Sphingobium nicotianae]